MTLKNLKVQVKGDMHKEQNQTLIIWMIAACVIFVALIALSLHTAKLKKSFRNEMAQRLDLEEKLNKVDQQREGLITQLKTLQSQMDKTVSVVTKLQFDLNQAKTENVQTSASQEPVPATTK